MVRYETILVADDNGVRTVTLNRPERRNALNVRMQQELIAVFNDSSAASIRAMVLTGAGDSFCSGLDLSELQMSAGKPHEEAAGDAQRILHMFRALYELPIPTIAGVNGAAMAGGAGLAVICDFVVATSGAKFGFTEARVGFVPALVSAFLALQVGGRHATDLLLTARTVGDEEAARMGLVNTVVPSDRLGQEIDSLVQALIANSPESLAATKRLLAAQNQHWLDEAIQLALEANMNARQTTDFTEGVAAFLEKRKPRWQKDSDG